MADGAARIAAGMASDVEALVAAYPSIEFIDTLFIDICGVARGKRLTVEDARKVSEGGVEIPRSIYLLDATGDCLDPKGKGFSDGDPDDTAVPVAGSWAPHYFPDGGSPRAGQVLMRMARDHHDPLNVEPRAILARVADRFEETDLTPVVAIELEFYLIDSARNPDGSPQPPVNPATKTREHRTSVYDIYTVMQFEGFLRDVDRMARLQGLPVTVATSEFAPGQFEINLRHVADPLTAADDAALLRHLIICVAAAHDFEATFMSKPFLDQSGSGMHIHMSLEDSFGNNVFANGQTLGSDTLRHAVGGLAAGLKESMAILASNRNAFRRFQPNLYVPVKASWGFNNRSCAFRIPAGPDGARRVEHRVGGAEANPYLALAAVLAGLHHGIVEKLDPGAPETGNAGETVDPDLPLNVDWALDELEGGTLLRDYLGADYVDLYVAAKRSELEKFRSFISPLEYSWYL